MMQTRGNLTKQHGAALALAQFTIAFGASLLALGAAPAAADTFEGLAALPGYTGTGRAFGISGDGGIVVGYADQPSLHPEAFRWTVTGGMASLGLPGDSKANGISSDGSTIVGSSNGGHAFRWTDGGGFEDLGAGEAFDVNADGSVVVGVTSGGAFRWTQGGGMVALGGLSGANSSQAKGVSDDGEIVVGVSNFSGGGPGPFGGSHQEAFRWTQTSGFVALGDLAGGNSNSDAYDISGDGEVIVGTAKNASSQWEAFRWTESGGMVGLGLANSYAYATNENGAVIVGKASNHAMVWTQADGARLIADVLTGNGVDMTGWTLESAEGVSDDGEIVVGVGYYGGGFVRPWIAHLSLGLVTLEDLSFSLSSVVGVGQSAQQVESAHLGGLIDLASTYGPADDVGSWSAWGGISSAHYDVLKIDPEARQADLGFAHQLTHAWRVGAGVRWGGREDDLPVYDSNNDSTYRGVSVFAGYEPGVDGLRIHTAFAANWIENEIERGYLNGSARTSSRGDQDGFSYGAAVRAGWAFGLSDQASITPFVAYEASRIELDAYTETGGPFPAHFNSTKGRLDIARAGAQFDLKTSDTLRFWISGAYATRVQDELPDISGEVMAFQHAVRH